MPLSLLNQKKSQIQLFKKNKNINKPPYPWELKEKIKIYTLNNIYRFRYSLSATCPRLQKPVLQQSKFLLVSNTGKKNSSSVGNELELLREKNQHTSFFCLPFLFQNGEVESTACASSILSYGENGVPLSIKACN